MARRSAEVCIALSLLVAASACRGRARGGGGAASAEATSPRAKTGGPMDDDRENNEQLPHATVVARAMEELRIRTASFDRLFQMGDADWQLDQDGGTIVFTSPKGLVATAPAQIAGTYDTDDGTWLWAWDNPSIAAPLTAHAKVVREYGKRRGIAELTTRKLKITEDKAWELAALTCKLGKDQAVYRGPAGATMVFITFGEVTLTKGK
jgi:hypothetical protein